MLICLSFCYMLYIVHCTLYSVTTNAHIIVDIQWSLYTVMCTLTLYTIKCTVYTVYYTVPLFFNLYKNELPSPR